MTTKKNKINVIKGASRPFEAEGYLEVGVASGSTSVNLQTTITARLECGDLPPQWHGRQNESGYKSPPSISDSLFVGLWHASRGRNGLPLLIAPCSELGLEPAQVQCSLKTILQTH